MKTSTKTIVVQTPGDMSYLHRIREFIAGIAIESGVNPRDIDNIELAVDEACSNVIEHGYESDDVTKEIIIRMEINTSKLILTVIDHARPFNILKYQPEGVHELTVSGADGGLGIRLIKRVMDSIDYRTTPDGQNELIMTKYFTKTQ
jgi:anti-sigma regulatory factor (Ser/Thr protein kinase)